MSGVGPVVDGAVGVSDHRSTPIKIGMGVDHLL